MERWAAPRLRPRKKLSGPLFNREKLNASPKGERDFLLGWELCAGLQPSGRPFPIYHLPLTRISNSGWITQFRGTETGPPWLRGIVSSLWVPPFGYAQTHRQTQTQTWLKETRLVTLRACQVQITEEACIGTDTVNRAKASPKIHSNCHEWLGSPTPKSCWCLKRTQHLPLGGHTLLPRERIIGLLGLWMLREPHI